MNCGICHGAFNKDVREPLLLPACGHSLCRSCLALLTTHRGFSCPVCRVKQPHVELSSLHRNHALLDVITAQKEENGRNMKKGRGKEDNNSNSNSSNSHNTENNIAKNKEILCQKHGGTRLAYWCGTCEVAGCGECVVDEHSGGGNPKRHEPRRFDAALKKKRDDLQNIVDEIAGSLGRAEMEGSEAGCQKSSFVIRSRKLLQDIGAVIGKLWLTSSFLACQIQETEDEDAIIERLHQKMSELLCQVPQASSSSSAAASLMELLAVMEYHKKVEKFRDGPVTNMLKERTSRAAATNQRAFVTSSAAAVTIASAVTALNVHAASLCRKMAHSGGVEVVGGSGGRVGRVSWGDHNHSLHSLPHLHCFQSPPTPRHPPTHPSRRCAVKWPMVQKMMHEVTKVFMVLAWGQKQEEQWIYVKLNHSTISATTTTSPHRRFIHLLLGDDDNIDSLLGPLSTTVEEVVAGTGMKGIYLGTHEHNKWGDQEGMENEKEHKSESKPENSREDKAKDPTTGPSLSAGDVVCVREQKEEDDKEADNEGDLEFWLVTEGWKISLNLPPVAGVEVVGSLLPLHHQPFLAKIPGFVGVRVEDCGVLLPCDGDEEKEEEGVKPNIPSHHTHHQHQQPVLTSNSVQTERKGIKVFPVRR